MKNQPKYQIPLFIFFCVVIIFAYLIQQKDEKKIKINHIVVCGKITRVYNGRGGNSGAYFNFFYNGKVIKNGPIFCTGRTKERVELGDSSILVVIENDHPYNSSILEKSEDFEKFEITKEDTTGLNCQQFVVPPRSP